MAESQTFDLRECEFLDEAGVTDVLRAQVRGPVTLLLTPGSHPAVKLATLLSGLLREARPGVWRLAGAGELGLVKQISGRDSTRLDPMHCGSEGSIGGGGFRPGTPVGDGVENENERDSLLAFALQGSG